MDSQEKRTFNPKSETTSLPADTVNQKVKFAARFTGGGPAKFR